MQATGVLRAGVGTIRSACRHADIGCPLFLPPAARAAATSLSSSAVGYGHERSRQQQTRRGLAIEVDRMQHHIRVTDDMKISEPVKRVLTIDNASRPQQKQLARQLAIEHWRRHRADTGSPACQIASLTVRINSIHQHIATQHRKDHATKRGYVALVNRRRKMLAYLKRTDFDTYRKVHRELGLA